MTRTIRETYGPVQPTRPTQPPAVLCVACPLQAATIPRDNLPLSLSTLFPHLYKGRRPLGARENRA